ncbi:hypothetical protein [Nostoc sp. ChiQUE01b]|nr:hypothetical protein [Nostoc sp. ChiQUE01b]MDZ8257396.1 hypothetical protein [Nostoc sp. ChiQUE01b]
MRQAGGAGDAGEAGGEKKAYLNRIDSARAKRPATANMTQHS